MKKGVVIILLSCIVLLCVTGCSSNKPSSESVPSETDIPSLGHFVPGTKNEVEEVNFPETL